MQIYYPSCQREIDLGFEVVEVKLNQFQLRADVCGHLLPEVPHAHDRATQQPKERTYQKDHYNHRDRPTSDPIASMRSDRGD